MGKKFIGSSSQCQTYKNSNYSLTLSRADLRCNELRYITNKFNEVDLSDKKLENLSYHKRGKLMMITLFLLQDTFSIKSKFPLKKIAIYGRLDKTRYYALQIAFQERSNPHIHSFVWILNAPATERENSYIDFLEGSVSASLIATFLHRPRTF